MVSKIISAAPSQGKSYLATHEAIKLLKNGKTVFTNYPIIYKVPYTAKEKLINLYRMIRKVPLIPQKELCTFKWDDKYIDAGLHDCTIILDEAYKIVNCHDRLTESQHDFFATTGHNNVDVLIIAQNYRRINLVIREMALFIIVSKFSNPITLISSKGRKELTPLFFTIETYLSERDYQLKGVRKDAVYEKKRLWFNKDVAESYNTQYYRRKAKIIHPISWIQDMRNNNIVDLKSIPRHENELEEKMKKEFIEEA
jgi:hypothetical protein